MFHDFIRALLLLHLSFTYRGRKHYGEGGELARLGLLTADVFSIVMMYIQALPGWWMTSSQNWGNRRKENGEYSGGGDRI